jgi:hypothetical protein
VGKKVVTRVVGRSGRLGPWPVQPGAVASREDLIRAFEYLAILRLGGRARSRNHLAVADGLRTNEPDLARREAAGELARLYEKARYEPARAPLEKAEVDAARRDLTLLARAAAA